MLICCVVGLKGFIFISDLFGMLAINGALCRSPAVFDMVSGEAEAFKDLHVVVLPSAASTNPGAGAVKSKLCVSAACVSGGPAVMVEEVDLLSSVCGGGVRRQPLSVIIAGRKLVSALVGVPDGAGATATATAAGGGVVLGDACCAAEVADCDERWSTASCCSTDCGLSDGATTATTCTATTASHCGSDVENHRRRSSAVVVRILRVRVEVVKQSARHVAEQQEVLLENANNANNGNSSIHVNLAALRCVMGALLASKTSSGNNSKDGEEDGASNQHRKRIGAVSGRALFEHVCDELGARRAFECEAALERIVSVCPEITSFTNSQNTTNSNSDDDEGGCAAVAPSSAGGSLLWGSHRMFVTKASGAGVAKATAATMPPTQQRRHHFQHSSAAVVAPLTFEALVSNANGGRLHWRQLAASFSTMMRYFQKARKSFCWVTDPVTSETHIEALPSSNSGSSWCAA